MNILWIEIQLKEFMKEKYIDFHCVTSACWLLHFNKVRGLRKNDRSNQRRYFCSALINVLQTCSNDSQHNKRPIVIFDIEQILMNNDYISIPVRVTFLLRF